MRAIFTIGVFTAVAGLCHMHLTGVPYGMAAVVVGVLVATPALTAAV
jgi:hypothetical protein